MANTKKQYFRTMTQRVVEHWPHWLCTTKFSKLAQHLNNVEAVPSMIALGNISHVWKSLKNTNKVMCVHVGILFLFKRQEVKYIRIIYHLPGTMCEWKYIRRWSHSIFQERQLSFCILPQGPTDSMKWKRILHDSMDKSNGEPSVYTRNTCLYLASSRVYRHQ